MAQFARRQDQQYDDRPFVTQQAECDPQRLVTILAACLNLIGKRCEPRGLPGRKRIIETAQLVLPPSSLRGAQGTNLCPLVEIQL
jgi:hypothetical protein